ncbi:hypothetical protein TGRH88_024830 [Toxoplasma gondii]|uniref:Uncharacterized protein n=1 Tax=Toxoplasma gondii TaxID=5811 RepID=A0A7J6K9B6_TOXGO|nr:hypothetical protein TGRH88_024830 [Toxoplasma gondii]
MSPAEKEVRRTGQSPSEEEEEGKERLKKLFGARGPETCRSHPMSAAVHGDFSIVLKNQNLDVKCKLKGVFPCKVRTFTRVL